MTTGTIIRSAIVLTGEWYDVIDFANVVRIAFQRDGTPFVLDLTHQEAADLGAALQKAAAQHDVQAI